MKHTPAFIIRSLADVLTAIKSPEATIWDFYRGDYTHSRGTITIYADDMPGNRRDCYTVRIQPHKIVWLERNTLTGYDARRNAWTVSDADERQHCIIMATGDKKLREYLAQCATILTGHPNPERISVYPTDREKLKTAAQEAGR